MTNNACFIIAGGDSLRYFNFQSLWKENKSIFPTFAINQSFIELYKRGCKCDKWVFWDLPYYEQVKETVNEFQYNTEIHTIDRYGLKKYNEWTIDRDARLSRKDGFIGNMNSTLAMAINVALQQGFNLIFILGADNKIERFYHWYDKEPCNDEFKKHIIEVFKLFSKFAVAIDSGIEENERLIQVGGGLPLIENWTFEMFEKWIKKL